MLPAVIQALEEAVCAIRSSVEQAPSRAIPDVFWEVSKFNVKAWRKVAFAYPPDEDAAIAEHEIRYYSLLLAVAADSSLLRRLAGAAQKKKKRASEQKAHDIVTNAPLESSDPLREKLEKGLALYLEGNVLDQISGEIGVGLLKKWGMPSHIRATLLEFFEAAVDVDESQEMIEHSIEDEIGGWDWEGPVHNSLIDMATVQVI